MKLAIRSVKGIGDIGSECVWLDVTENIDDLHQYALCDTTYDDGHVSNELRHVYWFAPRVVKKNDRIQLLTRRGVDRTIHAGRRTTHVLHWGLGKTVWNRHGDAAILLEIDDTKMKVIPAVA